MSHYHQYIREDLAAIGRLDLVSKPEEIEEWMRVMHPTLDHLSRQQFRAEVKDSAECYDIEGSIIVPAR